MADGSSLTYTYLADGTKVSAVSGCGHGLKYRGSFVYETGDSMDDCLQSIAWDEGRIMLVTPAVDTLVAIELELPEVDMPVEEVADSALVDIAAGMLRDLFFVIDHLGNVRSVVDVSPDLTEPAILEQDDYLPFGTRVQNPSFANVDDNRYRYAGKEEQRIGGSDISLLDFGARYYDPYIARWTSVDPMAYIRMSHNPYLYCSDNPLNYTDKKGLFDIRTGEIQKGDDISSITQLINEKYKLNLTTNDIAKANGLNISDDLKLGSFIKLPGDNVHLAFDLHKLQVIDDTYNIELPELSWVGTSGRTGYQSKEHQTIKNYGPIPEGSYIVNPASTQQYERSFKNVLLGLVGKGKWPGGTSSWGFHRTWIFATPGSDTYSRGGFSIHGGSHPGSAGCIDLTSNNDYFHTWLTQYNVSLR